MTDNDLFIYVKEGKMMLQFIIVLLVISTLMDDREGARRMLRGIFTCIAVMYGIRIILYTGFHLLPMIIIVWAVVNVILPFCRGFIGSFRK